MRIHCFPLVTPGLLPVLAQFLQRNPALHGEKENLLSAYRLLKDCYDGGGLVLTCGNGGSAADSEHIVGELMKGFENPRKLKEVEVEKLKGVNGELGEVLGKHLQGGLPAIALDGHFALSTAYMNDCEPLLCFAQQVNGYGKEGDGQSPESLPERQGNRSH